MGTNELVNADGSVAYIYTSKLFDRTLNDVCSICNNGWMSDMENSAQPIITKMLREKSFVLDKKKQERVAIWAIKTVLVMNHNNPPKPAEQYIPTKFYNEFYERRCAGTKNIVLLGYTSDSKFKPGKQIAACRLTVVFEHIQVPVEIADSIKAKQKGSKKIYAATLKIASIIFQVIGQDIFDDNAQTRSLFTRGIYASASSVQ